MTTAVLAFIKQRVSKLAQQNKYDEQTERALIKNLVSNADDTFLWVALVCQHTEKTNKRHVLRKLKLFPPRLNSLYQRMLQQIFKIDNAELCKQVLAAVTLLYRPVTLKELVTLVKQLEDIADDTELQEIIKLCGSFLTLREHTVYFVHQSAKKFLLDNADQELSPAGPEAVHQTFFTRSLQIMSTTLRRDMYGLEALGMTIDEIKMPEPDPLAALRCSCVHWIDHLCELKPTSSATYAGYLRDGDVVDEFLSKMYLYWLESLSLCKSVSKGVVSMGKLQILVQRQREATGFTRLVYDAHRFVMYHKQAIESSPLQAYRSALLFSPTQSIVRQLFQQEGPKDITVNLDIGDEWTACLQTLEGHVAAVTSVAFSLDVRRLASASQDRTIKIWDVSSGACMLTLKGHGDAVNSVAFSPNMTRLALPTYNSTIKIWDISSSSGAYLQTLKGHSRRVRSVTFSPDLTRLASASYDGAVKIWDKSGNVCIRLTLASLCPACHSMLLAPISLQKLYLLTSMHLYARV